MKKLLFALAILCTTSALLANSAFALHASPCDRTTNKNCFSMHVSPCDKATNDNCFSNS